MSDANRVQLSYIEEATWGVTPGAAGTTWQPIRMTGESLTYGITNTQSSELRSDRMISDLVQTGADPTGGINFELSFGTFDALFEGAAFADWSTPGATATLKIPGITEHSYTIEKAYEDITKYFRFKGMEVNTMSVTCAADSIVTGTLEFVGKEAVSFANPATNYFADTTSDVMNAVGGVENITIDGTTVGSYIQEISFTMNNNIRGLKAIGFVGNADVSTGTCEITGTMNIFFSSTTWYDKLVAAEDSVLQFDITDETNTYTLYFPRIKFETGAENATGINTDVLENLTWRAIRCSTTTPYMLRIIRNNAPGIQGGVI